MCNACGNVCCGSDQFEKCGCDGCECDECWSDDNEFDGPDDDYMDYELPNPPMENSGDTGNARAVPAMTGCLPVAGTLTNSGEAVAAELYRFACKQLD
jgi:hypothetical protein